MNQLVTRVVIEIVKDMDIPSWTCGETYESIVFPEGYEKPPKEEFETLMKVERWKDFRQERDGRLAEVDWIFSTDYHIPDQLRDEWTRYRQALRDLPSLTEDPENPVWPEKPTVNPSGGSTVSVDLDHLAGIASQVTLLQNVVFSLTKRIEQLEQA